MPDFPDKYYILKFIETGDPEYYGVLYQRYFQQVYAHCLRLMKDPDAAFDTTQDVFVKLINKLNFLKKPESFGPWLYRVVYNACINRLKKNHKEEERKRAFAIEMESSIPGVKDPDPEALKIEKLIGLISELPEKSRELIQLKYKEGKSIKELQKYYGVSESGIKMRLSRAKKRLARMYEPLGAA